MKSIERIRAEIAENCRECGFFELSNGTLNLRDLCEIFKECAKILGVELGECSEWEDFLDFEDKFSGLAPTGFYFGSHPGDGACIGFFPEPEASF